MSTRNSCFFESSSARFAGITRTASLKSFTYVGHEQTAFPYLDGNFTYENAFFPLTGKAKTALGVSKTFHFQRCYFPFRAPKKAMLELRLGAGRNPSITPLLTLLMPQNSKAFKPWCASPWRPHGPWRCARGWPRGPCPCGAW